MGAARRLGGPNRENQGLQSGSRENAESEKSFRMLGCRALSRENLASRKQSPMTEIAPQKYRDKAAECRRLAETVKANANLLSMAREWDEMADFADGMLAANILAFLIERDRRG